MSFGTTEHLITSPAEEMRNVKREMKIKLLFASCDEEFEALERKFNSFMRSQANSIEIIETQFKVRSANKYLYIRYLEFIPIEEPKDLNSFTDNVSADLDDDFFVTAKVKRNIVEIHQSMDGA